MTYDNEIRNEVENAIKKANELYAGKYNKVIHVPKVQFSNRMTATAGRAIKSKSGTRVVFSRPIIELNDLEQFKTRTVWHEVAHIVQFELGFTAGHNTTFYRIMQAFGVPDATRCHSYKTPTTVRRSKSELVVCSKCNKEFPLGAVRIQRMKSGTKYKHNCGGLVRIKY